MEKILTLAKECFEEKGVYPISFSFPSAIDCSRIIRKTKQLATVVPGKKETYIFDTQEDYYEDYQISQFAITHKKSGWDCLRHLEIISNRCIPLFVDIDACPKYNMIHYPKQELSFILENYKVLLKDNDLYMENLKNLVLHFNSFLTSEKMVEYLLRLITKNQPETIKSVLFIDSNLPRIVDYLSATLLIGLKQTFKKNCEVLFPVDYIYSDCQKETKDLYGKGFSYSKLLDPDLKTESEREPKKDATTISKKLFNQEYDLIVYGSVSRCLRFFRVIKELYPKEKIIGLYGEDVETIEDPIPSLIQESVKSEMTLFVREFQPLTFKINREENESSDK